MVRHELYSTGSNSHGQLGLDSLQDSSVFTQVPLPPGTRPLRLAFGANHTLLVAAKGDQTLLLGAGSNAAGQLGTGPEEPRLRFEELSWEEFVPQDVGISQEDYEVEDVASSWGTSFVHLRPRPGKGPHRGTAQSDFLVSFGSNDWGERGSVDARLRPNPTLVSLSRIVPGPIRITNLVAGPRHVLAAVRSKATDQTNVVLMGWGASRHGQLGSLEGTTKLPKMVAEPELVQLPSPFQARHIIGLDCGRDHTTITLLYNNDPVVILLGSDKHGQLGLRAFEQDDSSAEITARSNILRIRTLLTANPLPMPLHPFARATWNSTFLAFSSAELSPFPMQLPVMSFGSNSHGQLGSSTMLRPINPTESEGSPQTEPQGARLIKFERGGLDSSIKPRHRVVHSKDQCPRSSYLRLATGSEHALVVLESTSEPPPRTSPTSVGSKQQQLFAWGWNEHGNLGLGPEDLVDRSEPVLVGGIVQERINLGRGTIENVWAGMATSWVSLEFPDDHEAHGKETG